MCTAHFNIILQKYSISICSSVKFNMSHLKDSFLTVINHIYSVCNA